MAAVRVTETEFQAQVVQLATLCGWQQCHTRRSIGKGRRWTTATSKVGWPDLVLWHPDRGGVLFVELKTDDGDLSDAQTDCLHSLAEAGADVRVWRPALWDTDIVPTLTFKERAR